MKTLKLFRTRLLPFCLLVLINNGVAQNTFSGDSAIIIKKENKALTEWINRNVWEYLNLMDKNATYIDQASKQKIKGFDVICKLIEPWDGKIHAHSFEMYNMDIEIYENIGILSYNLLTFIKPNEIGAYWNTTEIYKKTEGEWKIIHAHWSKIKLEDENSL